VGRVQSVWDLVVYVNYAINLSHDIMRGVNVNRGHCATNLSRDIMRFYKQPIL
jgi:hypothetical protein